MATDLVRNENAETGDHWHKSDHRVLRTRPHFGIGVRCRSADERERRLEARHPGGPWGDLRRCEVLGDGLLVRQLQTRWMTTGVLRSPAVS